MRVGTFCTEMETKTFFGTLQAHFGLHFGGILEALGTLLDPRGGIGEVWEGSENKVEKRDPPKSCE